MPSMYRLVRVASQVLFEISYIHSKYSHQHSAPI